MKVKQLISRLKEMPQDIEVGYAAHDNSEEECTGWCESVFLFVKSDYDIKELYINGVDMFEAMPDRCVIIRG